MSDKPKPRGAPSERFKFTDARLKRLKPKVKEYFVYDTEILGLQCRITPASKTNPEGNKTLYIYRRLRGSGSRRVRICRFGDIALRGIEGDTVQTRASDIIADLTKGVEPSFNAKQGYDPTLKEAFEYYIENQIDRRTKKPLSDEAIKTYRRSLRLTFGGWQNRKLSSITPDEVETKFKSLSHKPASANKAFVHLNAVYGKCYIKSVKMRQEKVLPPNPCMDINWYPMKPRTNIVGKHELELWWSVVDSMIDEDKNDNEVGYDKVRNRGDVYRDYFQFVILTGLRRNEASRLTWDRVNLKERTITIEETKNNKVLHLPITNYVYKMLKRRKKASKKGATVFDNMVNPFRAQIWVEDKERFGRHFSIHDLRRSFVTHAFDAGVDDRNIKDIVNHSQSDVTSAHYDQKNVDRLRKPMQKIESYILRKAYPKQGKVVSISNSKQNV